MRTITKVVGPLVVLTALAIAQTQPPNQTNTQPQADAPPQSEAPAQSAPAQAEPQPGAETASAPPVQLAQPYRPKFRGDPARSEAEAQILGYMRTVIRANKEYKSKQKKFAPSLLALAGHGSLTKRMAKATDRGDYTIDYRANKKKTDTYILTATPKQLSPDHRSFYADEDGKIRVEEDKLAGPNSPVLK